MTKSQMKFVAESYAIYFGRAADADTIKEYGLKENGKAEEKSVILENIIADADVYKGDIPDEPFLSDRLLITKSSAFTNFRLSPASVFAAVSN